MEDKNPESVTSPLGQGAGKSKLDTLSKDDLIKFAKKQMVAMQKIKSKCADLEKEVEVLKVPPHGHSDDLVIQELTQKIDVVLLEKAETEQSLVSLHKEHNEVKKQAQEAVDGLTALQKKLDLKNEEYAQMQKQTVELTANFEASCIEYESKISKLHKELQEAKHQWTEIEVLKESHQRTLTESQKEIENLQQEIVRLSKEYADDVRDLEEQLELNAADFERERERLLLLQGELSEQLALKEGYLQDVQEEEEDASRDGALKDSKNTKVLNLPASDNSSNETGILQLALEDIQSQNVMLQEELTFLRNVKFELESELKQVKEEFTMERDELEFRINELQMNKEDVDLSLDKKRERCKISEEQNLEVQTLKEPHSKELQELETCFASSAETEQQKVIHTINILTNEELDLRDRTELFIKQYTAMKEQPATSVQSLQEKLQSVFEEKDSLLEQLRNVETLDPADQKAQALDGLKMSFEDLSEGINKILLHLQQKETLVSEMLIFMGKTQKMSNLEQKGNAELLQVNNLESEQLSEPRLEEHINTSDKHLQLSYLSEECDALQRNMDFSQHQLSDSQCHITEMLQQICSESKVDGISDISALMNHLLSKAQEEKKILTQQFDERAEQLTVELERVRQLGEEQLAELHTRIYDLSQEKRLLQASLDNIVLDAEELNKDLSKVQAMNEKLSIDNQCLLTQVADLRRSLEEKGHKELSEESELQANEMKELQQSLAEKDSLISQLNEKVGHLQMCKESSVSDENENMKELSHKIEVLEKENKDKDERMNKIKAVAVKAKKELDSSKKEVLILIQDVEVLKSERDVLSRSMKDIIHAAEDYKNLMEDYDKQHELLDKAGEKLAESERHVEDLTKHLQNAIQEHELLSSEREDLMARIETLQSNVMLLESQILEMQKVKCGLERELEAERLSREQKSKDHQSSVKEVEELQAQLSKQKHQLQQTSQELEQLRKNAQQNTLLDMEMADYEKLVKELNHKLCERDKQIEELETKAQAQKEQEQQLNEEIESLKSAVDQGEEKSSRLKQLLVKTKKDLGETKQKEAEQMVAQSSLRGELEAHQQQLEEYKIQCSDLTAERHRLQEQLKVLNDQQQRVSGSYQISLASIQEECTATKADLAATVSEFESYKVRVHNVLKQQKHKSSAQTNGDAFKQERQQMEVVVEQLRSTLQETQQNLQSSTAELQQLHTEHNMLLERHNKILQETVTKEAEFRERLLSLQSENVALKSEHGQCMAQLTAQTEALRTSFREQLRHLQDEHCSTVETLQQHINRLEAQLFQLQKEPSITGLTLVHQNRKTQSDKKLADLAQFDLQGMAREEGEGMEMTETESVSSAGTALPSLEQLLTSPDPKHDHFVWQIEPSKEELTQKLNTATRSMEHLNSLLHETEATNAVLMEQITLLKSEIRRLERNQEREKSVANLEYLKNVLLQFIFLRSGSERQALLPVIHTMLQLSPEEKSKLAAIAQGEEESPGSRGSGWTSYLHSWSGIR